MKNVTVTLPDDLARQARVQAAQDGKSLSRWIADRLQHEFEGVSQREAMERFLGGPDYPGVATSQPKQGDPYERSRLLAAELAKLTGESVTDAVTRALRERLERQLGPGNKRRVAEKLMEIGRRAASLPVLDGRDPDEMLYDEFGLPK